MTRSIYVIKSAAGPVKIGIAVKPIKRAANMQVGNAVELKMHSAFEVADEDAAKAEKFAHQLLQDSRIRGEWFDVDADDAGRVVAEAIRQVGIGYEQPSPFDIYGTRPPPPPFSAADYQNAMVSLGLNQTSAANFLGVAFITSHRYATGKATVPVEVAKLLRFMQAMAFTPEYVTERAEQWKRSQSGL